MTGSDLTESVLRLYMSYPFPRWTREERHRRFGAELVRYRYLGLEGALPGARLLDVGCGTGNRSMLAAKHFGVAEFVGLDLSSPSLAIARSVAKEEGFERFAPLRGSALALPLADDSFDVVVSWGVLHHTPDPFGGLSEMVRVCRPGGFVGVFLYNKWNHWRHNIQKNKVSRLAGEDLGKRFEVAHRLYGRTPIEEMTDEEIAVFLDKYCHPHKSDHTLGETLEWFDRLGLEYWASYPPLGFRDLVGAMQYRHRLRDRHPLKSRLAWLLDVAGRIPGVDEPRPPLKRPSVLHRFVWQAVYAWLGRHGDYSGGAALAARKLPR